VGSWRLVVIGGRRGLVVLIRAGVLEGLAVLEGFAGIGFSRVTTSIWRA
jgi:hypothetical protein